MIGKILNLTRNENSKQFKKISIKILIALIMIFAIALPIIINYTNSKEKNYMLEGDKHNLNYIESRITELSNKTTKESKIEKLFVEAEKEYYQLRIDNKVKYTERWKEEELNSYLSNSCKVVIIDSILNKVDNKVILNAMEVAYSINPGDVDGYFTLSQDKLKEEKNKLIKENEDAKKSIISNDYIAYLNKSIKKLENSIKDNTKQLDDTKKALEKDKDNKELNNQLENIKRGIDLDKNILQINQYRLKNKIPYDINDWKNNTLTDIEYKTQDISAPMLTEEEYKIQTSQGNDSLGKTYDDYKQIYTENKAKNEKGIKLGWYSLENNIPQLEFDNSARGIVDKSYDIFVMISGILAIIIAGSIVSAEFSKGTIRLLLIRPVSRFKILLSKLLSVFLIGYIVLLVSVLLNTISSGFVYGFNSLSTDVLSIAGENIIQTNYFVYMIPKMLLSSVSLIFVISMAFMLSTVVKNTAVSVGLTSILFLGSMPITMILANLKLGAVTQYILAYVNLPMFKISPFMAEMLKTQYGITLSIETGAVQLLICSVVFIVLSFISFMKSDIKN